MSRMVGADPDALDRLAADFDRSAGTLESTAVRVRASVHANPWSGAKATRFRNDWDQRHGPMLKRTALALRTAAKQLRLQAQEQRQASSAGGGAIGGGIGGGAPSDSARRAATAAGSTFMDVLGAGGRWFMAGSELVGTWDSIRETATGMKINVYASSILKGIGLGSALADLASSVRDGDLSGGMTATADGAFTFASAPVSLLYNGLKAEIGFFIPLDASSQDEHFEWMSSQGYTPAQVAERYDGVDGFIQLGNDNVERRAPWMNDAADATFGRAGEWLYDHGIRLI
jgi:uncharacterized protein YukE